MSCDIGLCCFSWRNGCGSARIQQRVKHTLVIILSLCRLSPVSNSTARVTTINRHRISIVSAVRHGELWNHVLTWCQPSIYSQMSTQRTVRHATMTSRGTLRDSPLYKHWVAASIDPPTPGGSMLQGTILKTFYGRLSLNNKITTGVHMVAGLEWSAVAFLHGITKILMSDPEV